MKLFRVIAFAVGLGLLPAAAAPYNEFSNLATSQVSVASTATAIVTLRTGRNTVTIENTATTAVYLGGPAVTTTTGMLLPGVVGASITLTTSGPVYGIVATGTETVSVAEVY